MGLRLEQIVLTGLKKFDGEGREEMNGGDKLIDEKRSQPLIGPY